MAYLMGLDIGTSGVKGLLVTVDGQIVAADTEFYPLYTPRPGWAEQNPADWWRAVVRCLHNLVNRGGIDPGSIRGISLSGQMHSAVFLDKDMEIVRPAILWSDTRTSKQCGEIYDRVGGLENLISYVYNPVLEGFTAPKILWLRENEPGNFKRVKLVLLPKDYIRYRLTGEVYTEVSDAAGTLLFDVMGKKWSKPLLDIINLGEEMLPPVVDSTAVVGQISERVARETGLKPGLSVVAGGADNACGAVGNGIIKEGRVMASIGTSGVVVAHASQPVADQKGRLHLFNHVVPDSWYMMGVMLSAGMAFSWLKRDLLADRYDYNALNQMAEGVEPGSEELIFLPYLYGERTPHADASARGVFFGISGKHKQGHFVRSVMEGVSFGLRDSLELIKDQGVEIKELRITGGGARSKVWQQILADIFGIEVSLLNVEEGPAFGAALIAGVGTGEYQSFSEAEEGFIRVTAKVSPVDDHLTRYNKLYQVYRELYNSLKNNFRALTEIGR